MGVDQCQRTQGIQGEADRAFSVLAASERRVVVEYFLKTERETATVTELVREYQQEQDGIEDTAPTDQLTTRFHHQHLPKLADAGVVEFDRESEQVRYNGDLLVEDLLESTLDSNGSELLKSVQ